MFCMAWSPSRRAFPSHYPSPFASVLYFMGTDLKLETLALSKYIRIYTPGYISYIICPSQQQQHTGSGVVKKKKEHWKHD